LQVHWYMLGCNSDESKCLDWEKQIHESIAVFDTNSEGLTGSHNLCSAIGSDSTGVTAGASMTALRKKNYVYMIKRM